MATTPAVLKRPVGRINRGRREPGRHGCGESPGAANHRVQRITGCGEAPESLEKRQRIRNILAKRTSSWEGGWGAGPPDVSDVFSIPNEKRDRNANRIGATLAGERAANEDRRRGRVREAPPRFVVPRTFAFPVDGGSRNTTENPGRRQKGGRKSQTPSRAAPRWRRPLPRDPAKQKPIGGWDNLPNHPGKIRPPGRKANYRRWGDGRAPTKPASEILQVKLVEFQLSGYACRSSPARRLLGPSQTASRPPLLHQH